ncbi:sulfotransferase family protein [Albimonas pacifica]|uniref:Sulfotransferase family protein n=1 Tax=Albimonas pacifica TaxID=1114924 RepID=A0A1I3HNV6_9RHOB|nr:sulfotransferase family protein [Albimonas pacifica]SFI37436.1 hypothetical protein SAMN05216258_10698 [Albimonas pacifica]
MKRIVENIVYKQLGYVPRNREFVFGIGLSKTGTTSLDQALQILGYRSIHLPPIASVDRSGRISLDWPWWVSKFDAATDMTVAVLFRELKATFPRAKFIHTLRPEDAWLDSCRRHFTLEMAEARVRQRNFFPLEVSQAFYGSILYDADKYRAAYRRHGQEVAETFRGDPNFLSFGLTQAAEWGPLCAFLGRPEPSEPFPFSNRNRARPALSGA